MTQCNNPQGQTTGMAIKAAINWGPIVSAAISLIGFAAIWGSDQTKIEALEKWNSNQDSMIADLQKKVSDSSDRQWDMKGMILQNAYRIGTLESTVAKMPASAGK